MRKKKDATKIYETAVKVFARYGYKKATLEDIAGELNMTKSNLYLYTRSKEDLYEQSVKYALLKWQNRVAKNVDGEEDVIEQFRVLCKSAFEYLARDKDLRSILINDPTIFTISPKEDRFKEINDASISMLKSILSKGKKEKKFRTIDVDHAAEVLFSIYVMFIIKAYVKSEGRSTRKLFDETLDIILQGLINQ
jgi:AcrR family transcriptional regulator